jgi:pteridine reductase
MAPRVSIGGSAAAPARPRGTTLVVVADTNARVALVTGAAIRVGRAIAVELAHAGWRVWIHHHHSAEQARALAEAMPEAVLGTPRADLADERSRASLCALVTADDGPAGGRVDLLVNSAASFEQGSFLQRSDADLRRVLELNLVAPLSLARRLAPTLARHGGSIVNIVDQGAHHPWRGRLDHGVAKAGLHNATRALAAELAPVRVNAISPGTVMWPQDADHAPGSPTREALLRKIPLRREGAAEDVARAVRFFADNDYVDGATLVVDGGRMAALGGGTDDA